AAPELAVARVGRVAAIRHEPARVAGLAGLAGGPGARGPPGGVRVLVERLVGPGVRVALHVHWPARLGGAQVVRLTAEQELREDPLGGAAGHSLRLVGPGGG